LDAFTTKLRPGVDISIGDNSALKQLIFEAQTFTVKLLCRRLGVLANCRCSNYSY